MSEGYHHFLAIRRATQSLNGGGNVFNAFCSTGVNICFLKIFTVILHSCSSLGVVAFAVSFITYY